MSGAPSPLTTRPDGVTRGLRRLVRENDDVDAAALVTVRKAGGGQVVLRVETSTGLPSPALEAIAHAVLVYVGSAIAANEDCAGCEGCQAVAARVAAAAALLLPGSHARPPGVLH